MRRLLFIFSFFCLPVASAGAQDSLALEDCLKIVKEPENTYIYTL